MLEIYLFETVQMVEQLEELLIEIENEMTLSGTAINEIFRIMHTIKGSSAMMMYDGIAHLAHSVEDLFALLRSDSSKEVDCHQLTENRFADSGFYKRRTCQDRAKRRA